MGTISKRLLNTGYYILVKDVPEGVQIECNEILAGLKTAIISSNEEGVTLKQMSGRPGEREETFVPVRNGEVIDVHLATSNFLMSILNEFNITPDIVFLEKEKSGKKDYVQYFEKLEE